MKKSPLLQLNQLILTLSPYEFTLLSTLLGYIISNGLNSIEVTSLGNFFENLGQTLLTIGSQMAVKSENIITNQNDIVNELKKKISNIEQIITNLKNLNL